ncbi:MAG: hypothetical protein J6P03_06640 [Opitutales bacterium]|nr:hypothetical protein [Opitutales bacterium]
MAETKTWKQSVGTFLTAKGAIIGGALVVIGSILEGSTNWIDGVVQIVKSIFGA